jgi:hypothetical protein
MSEGEIRQFFEDTLEFVKAEYGAENIMYATVHLDEKTPHMHFGFVPLTKDGRLSAKEVLGNKKKMSLLQDKFNDYVNEKGYKLKRGERAIETERKHVDVNNFKQQTEYHKRELEQVQNDFNASLEKWDKARQLNLQREKDEVTPSLNNERFVMMRRSFLFFEKLERGNPKEKIDKQIKSVCLFFFDLFTLKVIFRHLQRFLLSPSSLYY